jgi:hypothetical protein
VTSYQKHFALVFKGAREKDQSCRAATGMVVNICGTLAGACL